MKLYEEFMLWEHLWDISLCESKADIQQLIAFAGDELANRFLAVKASFKAPENDLYYWIKNKTANELEAAVSSLENRKSNTLAKKSRIDNSAVLVAENASWKVYHITSYEAAQVYGRDTKWCITGVDNKGDFYWKDYHEVRGVEFYFYITKQNYASRGVDSKYALAIWPKKKAYEIYDQQDKLVNIKQVPFIKELEIPGIDFTKLKPYKLPSNPTCRHCGETVYIGYGDDFETSDNDTKFYHVSCWYEKFDPDKVDSLTFLFMMGSGVPRRKITEPYEEALNRILTTLAGLNQDQKNSLMLDWHKIRPITPLVNIKDGKLIINDAAAGLQIEKAFNN